MNLALLLEAAASRSPCAPALCARGETLSYAELDALTRKLAGLLARRGVGPGQRVAVWLDKSALAVAAMQAALRLGAAYVPIDPLGPAARAEVIMADCQVRVLISDGAHDTSVAPPGSHVLRSDSPEWRDAQHAQPPHDLPRAAPQPDDLAYILYTSGSTGVPKGVCISHRNALAFVDWAAGALDASPGDRFANHAPLHFDLSVLDLYVAFRAGACVCMVPDTLAFAAGALADFLVEQQISVWYSVPSALALMAEHGGLLQRAAPALRAVLLAGEPFPVPLARALRAAWPAVRLLNLYGPTETNVCTFHEITPGDLERSAIPIGRACSGDRVFVRGEGGRELQAGEEGELFVEGPTVMLGYWGQPAQAGRAYATGDLVRALDDGSYLFCGRKDQLIKLRGYRVEIGEIEAALRAHPALADAGVVVSGAGLQARLLAFLVARGDERPTLLQIKAHCARQLPRHMIPDRIRHVRALPRTRNGKLDRRALAAAMTDTTIMPDSEQTGA